MMIDVMEAVFDRMDGSATLRGLVGLDVNGDINATPDWPDAETNWDDEDARITYGISTAVTVGAVDVEGVQVDVFVPKRLGTDLAGNIERELRALFHEKWWMDADSGKRIYTLVVNASTRPSSYRDPWHWMMEVAIAATT